MSIISTCLLCLYNIYDFTLLVVYCTITVFCYIVHTYVVLSLCWPFGQYFLVILYHGSSFSFHSMLVDKFKMDLEGAVLLTYSSICPWSEPYSKYMALPTVSLACRLCINFHHYAPARNMLQQAAALDARWTLRYTHCVDSNIVLKVHCQVLNPQHETNFDNFSLIRKQVDNLRR